MALCPSCATDNPGRAKFCLECGTNLAAAAATAAEERKVASVLFVDLVGFTAPFHDAAPRSKPEPIPLWRAVSAHSRFGVDVDLAPATPFIGHDFELDLLTGTFRRALKESSVQLATIAGEPGVGKTRLLSELFLRRRPSRDRL